MQYGEAQHVVERNKLSQLFLFNYYFVLLLLPSYITSLFTS